MKTTIKAIAAILFLSGAILDYFVLRSPYVTGTIGFIPTSILYVIAWITSVAMALLYLETILTLPDGSNLFTMTETYFGRTAKRLLAIIYPLFFSYPLLASFFTFLFLFIQDDFALVTGLHFSSVGIYLFFFVFIGLILFSRLWVALIVNFLLSIGIFLTNFLIFKKGASYVDPSNLLQSNWSYILAALPLFYFFRFQTTLPILSTFLKRNYKLLILVIILGILIPHLSLLGFQWLVIGSISPEDLIPISSLSRSVEISLELINKAPWYGDAVRFFGFFIVTNCFLINAYATLEIFSDGFKIPLNERRGLKRLLMVLLVLVPPALGSFFFYEFVGNLLVLALDFSDLLLSLLVLSAVWMIRYRLNLSSPRLLFGGKSLLIFLYVFLFYILWFHGLALVR